MIKSGTKLDLESSAIFDALAASFKIYFGAHMGTKLTSHMGPILDTVLDGLLPLEISPGRQVSVQVQVLVQVHV